MSEPKENLSFAERTKASYKKAVAEQCPDLKSRIKSLIEEVASRGAPGLQVWWDIDYQEEIKVANKRIRYHGNFAQVYIDRVTVDFSQICRWLSDEGFEVKDLGDDYGLAGYIMWNK